jgi:hypothetical protein
MISSSGTSGMRTGH